MKRFTLAEDPLGSAVLRSRFIEGKQAQEVARNHNLSLDSVHRRQRKAIRLISKSLAEQENSLRETSARSLAVDLPPPTYTHLFGVEATVQALTNRLLAGEPPWITTVAGIGGIGKTAVADRVARRAIRGLEFEHVIWIRLDPPAGSGNRIMADWAVQQALIALSEQPHIDAQGLPASQRDRRIHRVLRDEAHLIIIDNIEETAAAAALFDRLQSYCDPTHFLITARVQPGEHRPVFTQVLDELAPVDGIALLRHEATVLNIPDMVSAETAQLRQITQLVGGNPLALKLTTGLARVMSLPDILAELAEGRPGPTEEMYRHIYWKAWGSLTTGAQILLQTMLLVSEEGGRAAQLMAVSGLGETELWSAIRELVAQSLLEVRGTLLDRRYGIHRLTATFLQTEIVQWPDTG